MKKKLDKDMGRYVILGACHPASAWQAYQSQWPAPYVVFDEEGTWSLGCASQTYPDFSLLGADIYVSHHNMKWTMAFTHEQPHDGPFFAERRATPGR